MNLVKRYFSDWDLYEKIWLFLFTFIIIGLSVYWKDSLIGILASLTGIWCVVLIAKGKIANYYFGIILLLFKLTFNPLKYVHNIPPMVISIQI